MKRHSKHDPIQLNPDVSVMWPNTCRFGPHVSGEFAADVVVVGADVVKAPIGELVGAVKLKSHDIHHLTGLG